MQKRFLFLVCFAFCTTVATAQTVLLRGYVKDSLTHLPLLGATLSNSATGKKVTADGTGFFSLPVSSNDLLYAVATGYRYDTLRYALLFQDTITLFLSPVNLLQAVTVETGYRKYQLDSLQRRMDFEESRGTRLSAIDRSYNKKTFGLTFNLDRIFKNRDKDGNKAEQTLNAREKESYVRFRFSPQVVSYYTGLKSDALLAFMRQYTPSYDWLRSHPHREQLLDYLGESLKAYRKRKVL